MTQDDIILEQTCSACPEQYDAFYQGRQVVYLRLRHGWFRVDFPCAGGVTIYDAEPEGDGIFCDHERGRYLGLAKAAIIEWLERDEPVPGGRFGDGDYL